MNTNQYTQKTLEALQAAQQLAVEYQHNALEPEHLLHALASQEQGLIPQLLQKLNVDPGSFAAAVADPFIKGFNSMPRVILAPIFAVWFGLGPASKVALGVTLVFFIVFFNIFIEDRMH